jgi:hypothetical protein
MPTSKREDVCGLAPFSFGRAWDRETVKTCAVLPNQSSLESETLPNNTVFAVLPALKQAYGTLPGDRGQARNHFGCSAGW